MKRNPISGLLIVFAIVFNSGARAQEQRQPHRITVLKNVSVVALVGRSNDEAKLFSLSEINEMLTEDLRAKLPELKISTEANSCDTWLELSYVTSDRGMKADLSLYRWVRIKDTGDEVFIPVWNQPTPLITGQIDKAYFKAKIDDLMTAFAADYGRANPAHPVKE